MIRVAAVGDVHFGSDSAGLLSPYLRQLPDKADILLLAGDLTKAGRPDEAAVLAEELAHVAVPIVAVLGNHDYHEDEQDKISAILADAGVIVLEGQKTLITVGDCRLGIAATKGFGGGFADACATEFGEPETKAFIRHTKTLSWRLEEALRELDADADLKIALLHYSPVSGTLAGERLEIYPFLGSYLLAEAVDRAGADLVVHGHSHGGREKAKTPGGVHVRNVAQPVIKHAYNVYSLSPGSTRDWGGTGPLDFA